MLTGILLATLEPLLTAAELLLELVFDSGLAGDEVRRLFGSKAQDASWKCLAHSSGEYFAGAGVGDGTVVSCAGVDSVGFDCVDVSWKVLALDCWRKALEDFREGVADLEPFVAWAAAKTLLLVKSPAHCSGTKDVLILSSLRLLAMFGLKVSALIGIVNLLQKKSASD